MTQSVAEQTTQLGAARQLVLADAALYPQIIPPLLPIIGVHASLEVRRWGAEFLAETFASLSVSPQQKQQLSIIVLQTLRESLESPNQDVEVAKNIIQAAAGVYGHVFRYVVDNPKDTVTWQTMVAIKSSIFKRWDTAPMGVRISCIKFAQRVVQIQTMGAAADPRRPEQNETSLALVAKDHPLIPPSHLGAEASALLDRLLDVFIDNDSDAILVDATLNCMNILIRTRSSSVSDKIVSAILNFYPSKFASGSPPTLKMKIRIKSMERTMRALLMNLYRRNENGPWTARIRQHVDRVAQMCFELFNEGFGRKRVTPAEPSDGLDDTKRQRLGAELPAQAQASPPAPPLPEGPVSAAQLFTLSNDPGLTSFDVTQLPFDLMVKIFVPLLQHIPQQNFDAAIGQIRARHEQLLRRQQTHPPNLPPAQGQAPGNDEYEPDFEPEENAEQIENKIDGLPAPQDAEEILPEINLGPYKLPQPPQMTPAETIEVGKATISRVFGMMNTLPDPPVKKPQRSLYQPSVGPMDKEKWTTLMIRLATRSTAGLEGDEEGTIQSELQKLSQMSKEDYSMPDSIRETLRTYILEDFRDRMPTAVKWLTEEWITDKIQEMPTTVSPLTGERSRRVPRYPVWSLRLLDGMLPYLDAKDHKHLIRFVGEIPGIDRDILNRVKSLAKDPERVKMSVDALHYLCLLRLPVRELALDVLMELYNEVPDAKPSITKVVRKYRPAALPTEAASQAAKDAAGGSLAPAKPAVEGASSIVGGIAG